MTDTTAQIQADFDRIALLSGVEWDHNNHYHRFLLQQLPAHGSEALEIGCGTGAFSRLLAKRFERVLALDLSPQMIRIAREHSKQDLNIDYLVADAMGWPFPTMQFDCVASIATLHHLPLAEMLSRMRSSLKAGGVLIVLDLYQQQGPGDLFTSLLAVPVSGLLQRIRTGRWRKPPSLRRAWAEHGRYDTYLTLAQVQRTCAAVLPEARVKKHLLWRYSLVWQKTSEL
jgi:ubiquinone/menaquinone biosynthesis C-methylase UbiE